MATDAVGSFNPRKVTNQEILPRNFGREPGSINMNLRFAKTFAFGPAREGAGAQMGGGGDRRWSGGAFGTGGGPRASVTTNRRYNLSISMSARNLFNHT